uniref:Uncharacterized protein n=1 Tax=Tanacetum cinerariifolium TaxID=118510 RepID=A0A6L2L0J7_TANCI|nr:hypothetical protein [Tanacetum cinerariifolium]
MTKTIKEEFEELESLKISDDSFTYNTSLEIFHEELHRMSRMDDDLFTYEDKYENAIHDHKERENKEEHEDEERCEIFDHHDAPVCNIRRFEMMKYSFGDDEEYVAIKECVYDDLTSAKKDACRTYQEIFHRMDEG